MGASAPVWSVAIAVTAALVVSDYVFSVRRTYPSTLREAPAWSAIYLAIAIAFGAGVWAFGGISMSVEYFACYVSNEALSIDNLFVFLFTVRSFAVPRIAQQKVLLLGIVLALAARTGLLDGRRVMTPMLLAMIASADRATRTSAPGARRTSARLDAEATTDGLG